MKIAGERFLALGSEWQSLSSRTVRQLRVNSVRDLSPVLFSKESYFRGRLMRGLRGEKYQCENNLFRRRFDFGDFDIEEQRFSREWMIEVHDHGFFFDLVHAHGNALAVWSTGG